MPAHQAQSAIRFFLRPPTWDDVPALFEIQADPDANDMAGVKPRTREVFMARWREVLDDPAINTRLIEIPSPGVAIDSNHREIAGSVSVFQADGHNMLGYWIARAHWGKGLASRAVAEFLTLEPRRPLRATAAATNTRSHRILEKCGFRCTGTRMGEETDRYVARLIADFVLDGGTELPPGVRS